MVNGGMKPYNVIEDQYHVFEHVDSDIDYVFGFCSASLNAVWPLEVPPELKRV